MDRMVLIDVPIVSANSMCFEHTCVSGSGMLVHSAETSYAINFYPGGT